MISKRIIPSLIIKEGELIHRKNFDETTDRYVGDPINAINIFNEYFTDEIVIIDIEASKNDYINYDLLKDLAGEAFTPLSYGGGIKTLDQAEKIIKIGYEKLILNNICFSNFNLIEICTKNLGAQSIIISIDIIKKEQNYFIYDYQTKRKGGSVKEFLQKIKGLEIGEVLITSVSHDGLMSGCDLELINKFESLIDVPIIYRGGLSSLNDMKLVLSTSISAITSSTFFIMKKRDGGIVLNYPSRDEKNLVC